MKKIIAFLLATVMCLSFAACGNNQANSKTGQTNNSTTTPGATAPDTTTPSTTASDTNTKYYKLGETVSTDIFEFTLNTAKFTVALNNVNDDDYFTPKEYDPQDDAKNPYVAPVGHTYAAFSYTVSNLNRASCEFHNGSFATVKYDEKDYNTSKEGAYFRYADQQIMDASGKLRTEKAGDWYNYPSTNLRLMTGEKITRRAYIDVAADIKDLTTDVEITIAIPNSDGSKTKFTYLVSEADRAANNNAEIEMSLDLALVSFTKQDGQEYFKTHMDEYSVVSGDQIANIASGKWDVNVKKSYGHWSGTFWFEDDGRIKDDYGYVNERTWAVDGDTIIIDGENVCEMRKVADGVYLLVSDGNPYILMQ